MSLVAYDASSDEESDNENTTLSNGTVSKPPEPAKVFDDAKNKDDISTTSLFNKLPSPKTVNTLDIQEEDDEFLHKKATPIITEKRPRNPVQITIPSLSEFKDIDDEDKKKSKLPQNKKGTGSSRLLDLLPQPKQEIFTKNTSTPSSSSSSSIANPFTSSKSSNKAKLIPDSVKNKSQSKQKPQSTIVTKNLQDIPSSSTANDSDDSDEDFFSLNATDDKLPEVSLNEINAMIAKKAAKMAEASAKLDDSLNHSNIVETEKNHVNENEELNPSSEQINIDEKALHHLVGSRAKRRKIEEVNIVELSASEVLPNKDEWLRTALASSTQYQPKGVLVDEEPAPGTRRKHQITYLAHQAKANESELQAMWAANRHSRRQTQSKYGF